jgi:hypothetical protein
VAPFSVNVPFGPVHATSISGKSFYEEPCIISCVFAYRVAALMVSTRARKQATAIFCSNPVQQAGVLKLVLSFLGREGLFVQTVSKGWQAVYNKITVERANSRGRLHSSSYTSCQAAFASAARLKIAVACGLRLVYNQRCAGRHADIGTLRVAFKLGLPRSDAVAVGAADAADLSKLIWLRTKQGCRFPIDIAAFAARAGSVQMLQWLKKKRFPLNANTSLAAAFRPHNIPRYNFYMRMAVSGMMSAAAELVQQVTLHSCSGCATMALRPTLIQLTRQLKAALCRYLRSCRSSGLHSTSTTWSGLHSMATCSCASGCAKLQTASGAAM